jgi:hypothetical protein
MEEKLVQVMMEQYKERGVDMYALLDDPLFTHMKLEQKVELMKKYASHISSGTSKTLSKKDIRSLIIDAGFSGLVSGALAAAAVRQASHFFNKPVTPFAAVASAIALGTLASSASTFFNTGRMVKNKADILKRIDKIVEDPSDENALSALVARTYQTHAPGASTVVGNHTGKTISHTMHNLPGIINSNIGPNVYYRTMMKNYEKGRPANEGLTEDDIESAVSDSAQNTHHSYQQSLNKIKHNILGT